MSHIEQLIGGYGKYQSIISISSYKAVVINRFNRGQITYDKAIRLDSKVNEWMNVLKTLHTD